MQIQTAVIQIDGPHRGRIVIRHENFGMDKPWGIFINLRSPRDQLFVLSFCH